MEYALHVLLQALGIGFHVMQKIVQLDKKYPEKSIKEIRATFFDEDWTTLLVSALVLLLSLVTHYIVQHYAPELVASVKYFDLWAFALSFVLGYAGQRLIYKGLGKASSVLEKKIDEK